jgi:hypothetical protein
VIGKKISKELNLMEYVVYSIVYLMKNKTKRFVSRLFYFVAMIVSLYLSNLAVGDSITGFNYIIIILFIASCVAMIFEGIIFLKSKAS